MDLFVKLMGRSYYDGRRLTDLEQQEKLALLFALKSAFLAIRKVLYSSDPSLDDLDEMMSKRTQRVFSDVRP